MTEELARKGSEAGLTEAGAPALLRAMFDAAVAAADPMQVLPAALPARPAGRVIVVGAGKAAARMAEAVESVWGPCEGLVITRYGYNRPTRGIEVVEASHPTPGPEAVIATRRILELLEGAGPADFVLGLISGGGSALLCAPGTGISLADKQDLTRALLASGAPIDQINTVRKHLSAVKGGQLAAAAHPARMLTLMISDVPGDDPAFIASGPTVGDFSTPAEAIALLAAYEIPVPPPVLMQLGLGSGVLRPGDPRLSLADTRIVAAPAQSLAAAAEVARAAGCEVQILGDALEGEARDQGASQAREALWQASRRSAEAPPLVLLSGGECTVSLGGNSPPAPVGAPLSSSPAPVGGPNAEFLLAALIVLEGAPGIHALACDTDGVDGGAEVAGALIGPEVWARALTARICPEDALRRHDAHGLFAQLGAQVVTGPTLTNVNDFRAFLILPPAR
ncbi:MAG: glycerate kinase [Sphingomonadales bacterium]|nr:glycerate kinase [Sphingomonadales bacterium]